MKALALGVLLLAGCGAAPGTPKFTLYRNSPIDAALRIHFATFDAADKGMPGAEPVPYNQANCELAAEQLNANVTRLAEGAKTRVKFWCEPGAFREKV